jgi:sugar lactone lactonase YvrE
MAPVGTNWVTTTVAGLAGNPGFADGTNSSARFDTPNGIAIDPQGTLYVADFYNRVVRQIIPAGTNWVVSTIAGTPGVYGSADGTNANARFSSPLGVTVDGAGNLYISDFSTIRRMMHEGTNWIVTTLMRSPSGVMFFNQPNSLVFDSLRGDLYVAASYDNYIALAQPAFSLQPMVSGRQFTLSWPLGASNYFLETTGTPVNGSYTVTVDMDMTGPAAFYRLRSP